MQQEQHRTNIVLDENIIQEAIALSGIKTKRGVIDFALKELVAKYKRPDLRDLQGKNWFADDYDHKALRTGRDVSD